MGGMNEIHLTPVELAERWKLKPNTLARWRCTGQGPKFIRWGMRKILYPISEVEVFEKASLMRATHVPDLPTQ